MELIIDFIEELEPKEISNKYYLPSIIDEINIKICKKLYQIKNKYENLLESETNKYNLLIMMIELGVELEKTFNNKNNDILSSQICFLYGLIVPIIKKIKKICFEINLELIKYIKNDIINLLDSNEINTNLNQNPFSNYELKTLKFINVNGLNKNIQYNEMSFEDFGISIKILNYHCKDIFLNIIDQLKIFKPNNNLKEKKFDWYWKPIENINYNDMKETIINTNIKQNIELIDNYNQTNNIDHIEHELIENFKIIQKNQDFTIENKNKIIKQSNKQIEKNILNSVIIEDESFTIPIDNNEIHYQ